MARAFTASATSMKLVSKTAAPLFAGASGSPMTARVSRVTRLTATEMPMPVELPVVTAPATLAWVSSDAA